MGAPALALTAGATGAAGSISSGYAQAASANYNAKVAQANAQLATQNAQWEGAEGEQNVGVAGLKVQGQEGAVKVGEAANNVDIKSGSAVDVQKSVAEQGMLNEMNIRSNAARASYGFEATAAGDTAQAALDKSQACKDIAAGYVGGATSLLGAASTASMYSKFLAGTGITGGNEEADLIPAGGQDEFQQAETKGLV